MNSVLKICYGASHQQLQELIFWRLHLVQQQIAVAERSMTGIMVGLGWGDCTVELHYLPDFTFTL